jgi:hypothetical protein
MATFWLATKNCRIAREVRQGAFHGAWANCASAFGFFAEWLPSISPETRYKNLIHCLFYSDKRVSHSEQFANKTPPAPIVSLGPV